MHVFDSAWPNIGAPGGPAIALSPAEASGSILASVGAISAAAVGLIGGLFAARAEKRRRSVEQEMATALGLPPELPALNKTASNDAPSSSPEPPEDESKIEDSDSDTQEDSSSRSNYEQHVYVTLNGDSSPSNLADIVKQQSDGHARLIIKYYAQGHLQASVSFALSMVFAVIGFIIIAIALAQLLHDPQQPVSAGITGLVGIVNQAVSVLFFRRADKGRDLMMQLIDKLRNDRDAEMRFIAGLAAVEQVKSEGLRDALRASTALTFTGSSIGLDQLVGLLSSGALDTSSTSGTPSINIFGPKASAKDSDENSDSARTNDRTEPKDRTVT